LDHDSKKIIKIAITGSESTGKSFIAKGLSDYYRAPWVPEFARGYLNNLNSPYTEQDILNICKGQSALENSIVAKEARFLFCDTEMLVIKIWSQYKFGHVHPTILAAFNEHHYDLYLLMDIDLPWEYDPQREHPDKRKFFFEWFERELEEKKANYGIVTGTGEQRLKNAITIIDQHFPAV
jgi:NadR type nicotinamide-nucleotide adenylyltransferase